jgi:hypothetical protein
MHASISLPARGSKPLNRSSPTDTMTRKSCGVCPRTTHYMARRLLLSSIGMLPSGAAFTSKRFAPEIRSKKTKLFGFSRRPLVPEWRICESFWPFTRAPLSPYLGRRKETRRPEPVGSMEGKSADKGKSLASEAPMEPVSIGCTRQTRVPRKGARQPTWRYSSS